MNSPIFKRYARLASSSIHAQHTFELLFSTLIISFTILLVLENTPRIIDSATLLSALSVSSTLKTEQSLHSAFTGSFNNPQSTTISQLTRSILNYELYPTGGFNLQLNPKSFSQNLKYITWLPKGELSIPFGVISWPCHVSTNLTNGAAINTSPPFSSPICPF